MLAKFLLYQIALQHNAYRVKLSTKWKGRGSKKSKILFSYVENGGWRTRYGILDHKHSSSEVWAMIYLLTGAN